MLDGTFREAHAPEGTSYVVLMLLERLSPLERAAYVLSQAFDFDAREIAEVLGKNEAAARRARCQ